MLITIQDKNMRSNSLHSFVSAKRLHLAHWRAMRRPPLTKRYTIQFAPSPQGPCHFRSIAKLAQALDAFLAAETLSSKALNSPCKVEPRPPPIKWSSSARAPARNKDCTHSSPPLLLERGDSGTNLTCIPGPPTATYAQLPPPHCYGGGRHG